MTGVDCLEFVVRGAELFGGIVKESGTEPATTLVKNTETSCNRTDVSVVVVERTASLLRSKDPGNSTDNERKEGLATLQTE